MATKSAVKRDKPSPTTAFFEELGTRGHEPLLGRATGCVRVEISDGGRTENWYVLVDRGQLEVTHDDRDADAYVCADIELFDRVVTGRENAMAAVLRGAMSLEGALDLAILFQRLFPGPPPKRGGTAVAGKAATAGKASSR